jgi:SHS2 domain-containing protein
VGQARKIHRWEKQPVHETFDHTADLGLRIRTPNLECLIAEAGEALFSVIVEDLSTVQPTVRRDVTLSKDAPDLLLFDWLKQLLYWFDVEHLLFAKFEVKLDAEGLRGSAWGEPLDRDRHQLEHEVKAITYHGLLVEQSADGWLAEVIVDI